jgi:hypothetical protein
MGMGFGVTGRCQSRVYVKKGRKPQEYMIRYDNGESMKGVEEHLEPALDDGESEIASE